MSYRSNGIGINQQQIEYAIFLYIITLYYHHDWPS